MVRMKIFSGFCTRETHSNKPVCPRFKSLVCSKKIKSYRFRLFLTSPRRDQIGNNTTWTSEWPAALGMLSKSWGSLSGRLLPSLFLQGVLAVSASQKRLHKYYLPVSLSWAFSLGSQHLLCDWVKQALRKIENTTQAGPTNQVKSESASGPPCSYTLPSRSYHFPVGFVPSF